MQFVIRHRKTGKTLYASEVPENTSGHEAMTQAITSTLLQRGANLRWADLHAVDLHGLSFAAIDLSHADLRGANLHHTNFANAKIEGVLTSHKAARIKNFYNTALGALKRGAFVLPDRKPAELTRDEWHRDPRSYVGWIVATAGIEGLRLADTFGYLTAAQIIYFVSSPGATHVPDFRYPDPTISEYYLMGMAIGMAANEERHQALKKKQAEWKSCIRP